MLLDAFGDYFFLGFQWTVDVFETFLFRLVGLLIMFESV